MTVETLERGADLARPETVVDRRLGRAAELGALAEFACDLSSDAVEIGRRRNAEIGRAAVRKNVRISEVAPVRTDIAALLEDAERGSSLAEREATEHATSQVKEMIVKSGGVMTARAYINENSEIIQYGKTTAQRQENTLRTFIYGLPALQEMAEAEGQNGFTWEALHKLGLTKGKRMVEISLIPKAKRAALANSGLFLREVIGIIRTTEIKGNEVEFTSYLIGGTDQDELPSFWEGMTEEEEAEIEEQALANRFDIDVVRHMYVQMGVPDARWMTEAELLGMPVIVPDTIDGIDFAMFYDASVQDLTGKKVMMGLTDLYRTYAPDGRQLTRVDYEERARRSLLLQSDLDEVGQEVATELIQRYRETKGDGYKAGRLMHKIAESRAVAFIADRPDTYDQTVFGAETYLRLQERQRLLDSGDIDGADRALFWAQMAANGTGCPGGGNALDGSIDTSLEGKDQYGSLTFECPHSDCKKTNKRDPGELKTKCDHCKKDIPGC